MANVMQIQVENFLKIENEQMKIGQNNSYGQKLSETTNQVACEAQTHFRSSLRRERSDDRKCVCASQATNQGVEIMKIMNSKRQLKRKQHLFVSFEPNMFWACAAFTV